MRHLLPHAKVTLLPSGNVTCNYFVKSLKKGKRNSQSSQISMNRDVFPTEKRNFCEEASEVFHEIGTWLITCSSDPWHHGNEYHKIRQLHNNIMTVQK